MSSLWARTFSCCIRARSSPVGPHERTPLIRDTEQAPTPPLPRVVDHQKMKERLGHIVRSKEGKMVNVNAQIPFNLHNQNLSGRLGPSSSRSHSGGANANSNQNSRHPSPSPVPSLHMSRSSGSLQHPGDVASSHYSLDNEPKKPILNVRLVRGVGTRRASSSRVRGRLGRFGEETGREVYISGDGSSQREDTAHDDESGEGQDNAEDLVTPRPPEMVPQWAKLQEIGADASAEAPTAISRTPEYGFQNAGVLSRSWGD